MKKRFALYGMFAAMAIFATACGDDSSSSASAPEDEEYSSFVDDEESSSSEEAVSSSSTKKDGKSSSSEKATSSSSEKKDGKSSSSEKAKSSSSAKDDKSSSSEKPESSSSEPESSSSEPESSSSSEVPYGFTCSAEKDGNVVSMEAFVKTIDDKVSYVKFVYDYDNMKALQTMALSAVGVASCDAARGKSGFTVLECSDETGLVEIETDFTSEDLYPEIATPADAEKNMCSDFGSQFIVNTNSLNKKMLDAGEYGEFRDLRDINLYRTIKVGDQTWMAQNMDYEPESGSSCYDNELSNCSDYGRLYTWKAAQDACPDGWRLPTTTEWNDLLTKTMGAESKLDGYTAYTGEGISLLGGEGRANEYGLSFVFGGAYGSPEAEVPSYNSIGEIGVYWLADEEGNASGGAVLPNESVNMFADLGEANMQLYVRCVKK